MANLWLASHMWLSGELFVALDKCTRVLCVIIFKKTIIVPYVFQNVF